MEQKQIKKFKVKCYPLIQGDTGDVWEYIPHSESVVITEKNDLVIPKSPECNKELEGDIWGYIWVAYFSSSSFDAYFINKTTEQELEEIKKRYDYGDCGDYYVVVLQY